MKTVPPLTIINTSISQSNQTGQTAIPQKIEGNSFIQLSQGQLLRAIVVSAEPNNQFTLETGGSRFLVQSKVPLTTGQSLDLQVVSSGTKPELQILPDSVNQFFGRSLASNANSLDLTSFFNVLRQSGKEQLANVNDTSLKILQQFSQLQQQNVQPQSAISQRVEQYDSGQKLLNTMFSQLEQQVSRSSVSTGEQAMISTIKTALQDIALLFQDKAQISPATQVKVDNLPPAKQQVFEILSQFQPSIKQGTPSDALVNRLFQTLQLQPGSFSTPSSTINNLNSLQSGLSDLVFLLKAPDTLLQLFSAQSLSSGLLTKGQVESIINGSISSATSGTKEGGQLQQLVHSLGLNFEGQLTAGDVKGATNTVKSALLELVQNFMGQNKLTETGSQTLKTIEFYQLMQLQMERQDTLVLPLPAPFLEQGYLVIEDYKNQLAEKDGEQKTLNHFSLYLKLSPIGNLKIDFLYSGDGVYLRFNSDSKQISDFLSGFKKELSESISNSVVQSISFSEGGEDPLTTILQKSRDGATSILDTKI